MSSPAMPDHGRRVDRRHHRRKKIIESQLVTVELAPPKMPAGEPPRRGILIDVSEGGFAVQPFLPLAAGDASLVHFEIPGTDVNLDGSGTVAWVGRGGRAGIRFVSVPKPAREQLQKWLAPESAAPDPATETAPAIPAAPLAEAQLDLNGALQLVVERARAVTGASGAAIAVGDQATMVCRATVGDAPVLGANLKPGPGLSGHCLATGEMVYCTDAEADPRVNPNVARQLNMRSGLILPLFVAGELRGIVEVFSPQPKAFDSRHVHRLQRIAELLAGALEEGEPSQKSAAVKKGVIPVPAAEPTKPEPTPVLASLEPAEAPPRRAPMLLVAAAAVLLVIGAGALYGMRNWRASVPAPPPLALAPGLPAAPVITGVTAPAAVVKNPESPRPVNASTAPAVPKPAAAAAKDAPADPPKVETQVAPSPSVAGVADNSLAPPPLAVGTLGNTNAISAVVSVVPVSVPRLTAESARASELVPGRLIKRIEPQYPYYARNANIGGNVVLSATVTKRGTVEKIKVLSGQPLLTQAAVNAVRLWRYEPYKLNGEPVDVDTKITVRFDNGRVK